ncbi:UPF0613 protein PB24D3.06c [Astathelohania contejeani]|uniref:UPF0613 protein PB24D3.06c n=1 Tax=Astathelohania contejeani TaxID=164912 RepID=A0ABQ7HYS6_9MICR|nr:UPF0613 protein PB24D3.06c [Thelohania contejeani]
MDQQFPGKLVIYDINKIMFMNNCDTNIVILFVSGMGNNIFNPVYSMEIYKFCNDHKITFVQPQLRSYPHYGLYTLDDDIDDLMKVINYLGPRKYIFIGHSTGCQDIIYLSRIYQPILCILQGPVSDREYEEKKGCLFKKIPDENIFFYRNQPMIKQRYRDLYTIYGKDDIFSSDLPDSFYEKLNINKTKIYFVLSENDEYTFETDVLKYKFGLVKNSEVRVISGATHDLSNHESEFMNIIKEILQPIIK